MTDLFPLKAVVDTHPLLRHPLLDQMRQGSLSVEQVRGWATEQFYFSISLPACFAALYARIPAPFWQEKRELVELLRVEAWGANEPGCHGLEFRALADFLGLDIGSMTQSAPMPFTRRYLDARLAICLGNGTHSELSSSLAVVALANEYLNIQLFSAYKAAVTVSPEFPGCPLGYFDAHLHDEEADFEVFAGLYSLLRPAGEDTQTEEALAYILDERLLFFDSLHAHLN